MRGARLISASDSASDSLVVDTLRRCDLSFEALAVSMVSMVSMASMNEYGEYSRYNMAVRFQQEPYVADELISRGER